MPLGGGFSKNLLFSYLYDMIFFMSEPTFSTAIRLNREYQQNWVFYLNSDALGAMLVFQKVQGVPLIL